MAAKYTHLMRETGLSWNIDTDFPVILTFCLRRLDENDRNLYNYICICCQNERRQGAYFTKTRASAAQKEGSYFLISALYDGAQIIPLIIITSINPYIKKICICVLIQLTGL